VPFALLKAAPPAAWLQINALFMGYDTPALCYQNRVKILIFIL
jgi:hypothetical protein